MPPPRSLAQPPASPLPIGEILRRVAENQEKATPPAPASSTTIRPHPPPPRAANSPARRNASTPSPHRQRHRKGTPQVDALREARQTPPYTDPKFRHRDSTSTANWPNPCTDDLVNDKNSRDGLSRDMFPLTATEQRHYTFRFDGYQAVGDVQAIRSPSHPSNARKTPPKTRTAAPGPAPCSSTPMSSSPSPSPPNSAKSYPAGQGRLGINLKQLGLQPQYRKVAGGLGSPPPTAPSSASESSSATAVPSP